MALGLLDKDTLNYYGGFYELNEPRKTNSISFLKRMIDILNSKTLEKSEDLISLLDDTIYSLKSKKLRGNFNFDKEIESIESLISVVNNLNNLLGRFIIDEPLAKKIYSTNNLLISKLVEIKDLLTEYKEVKVARNEVKAGKTFNIDQILSEI